MRKYLALLTLIISSLLFVGCASVDYTRVYTGSGSIIDEISIVLDKEEFTSGKAQSVYNIVKNDVDLYADAIDNWAKTTFTGYIDEVSLYEVFTKGIKVDTTQMKSEANGYTFSIFITFKELYHFIYFYGLNTPEILEQQGIINIEGAVGFATEDYGPFLQSYLQGKYEIDNSPLFTYKAVWSSDNAYENFSRLIRSNDQTYLDYYISRINSVMDTTYTQEEVLDNVEINQHFQTTESRIKGDTTHVDGLSQAGFTIYSWNLNEDGEQTIDIYRARPVTVWWYVVAVVVSGLCVGFMFIKLRKNKEKLEELDGQ